jgi:hypothetical protein
MFRVQGYPNSATDQPLAEYGGFPAPLEAVNTAATAFGENASGGKLKVSRIAGEKPG